MAGFKHCFGESTGRIVSDIQRMAWGALWDYGNQVRCVHLYQCVCLYLLVYLPLRTSQYSCYPFLMSQMRDIRNTGKGKSCIVRHLFLIHLHSLLGVSQHKAGCMDLEPGLGLWNACGHYSLHSF